MKTLIESKTGLMKHTHRMNALSNKLNSSQIFNNRHAVLPSLAWLRFYLESLFIAKNTQQKRPDMRSFASRPQCGDANKQEQRFQLFMFLCNLEQMTCKVFGVSKLHLPMAFAMFCQTKFITSMLLWECQSFLFCCNPMNQFHIWSVWLFIHSFRYLLIHFMSPDLVPDNIAFAYI